MNLLSRQNLMMGAVLVTLYLVWMSTRPATSGNGNGNGNGNV